MRQGPRKFYFAFEKRRLIRFGGLSVFQAFCRAFTIRHFLQVSVRWPDYDDRDYHPADLFLAHVFSIVAGIGRVENTQCLVHNDRQSSYARILSSNGPNGLSQRMELRAGNVHASVGAGQFLEHILGKLPGSTAASRTALQSCCTRYVSSTIDPWPCNDSLWRRRDGRSKSQSFPRKRESTPRTFGNARAIKWIPAFAGMTGAWKGILSHIPSTRSKSGETTMVAGRRFSGDCQSERAVAKPINRVAEPLWSALRATPRALGALRLASSE
jgi:hypothetical protein